MDRIGIRSTALSFKCAFGLGLLANTTYFLQAPKTQVTLATSYSGGGIASPYDGFIAGVCVNWRNGSATNSVPSKLYVRIRKQKFFHQSDTPPSTDYLVTNDLKFQQAQAVFKKCYIPIKKGQLIEPYLITGNYSPIPTSFFNEFSFIIEEHE